MIKTVLLGGAAALAMGVAAFAFDGEDRTRVQLAQGSQMHLSDGHGTVVEVRSSEGHRTVHITASDSESRIEIDGMVIEIEDGEVLVDGDEVAQGPGAVVVVDGTEVLVARQGYHHRYDAHELAYTLEHAERAALMGQRIAHNALADVDFESLEEDIMARLEAAFASLPDDLESHAYDDGRRWEDLSPREQREVREALTEAREDLREAMRDVRHDLREIRHENHRTEWDLERVERNRERALARAERDMERAAERAERDAERAERDAEREERRWEREQANSENRNNLARYRSENRDVDSLRIETDDNGRRRIWVNGEEQTGDDLTEWLNRLESGRLDGGN